MAKLTKNQKLLREKIDGNNRFTFDESITLAKKYSHVKFDESVDVAFKLGVNPRHADQMIRSAVSLPFGTGKEVKVLVFAKGEKELEARNAGADYVGQDDMIAKIKDGWLEFDKVIATPDMMGMVGRIGRILGPRGLMPNPKVGTVTFDVSRVVKEMKAGRVEFRTERAGIIHVPIGRVSFPIGNLRENFKMFIETLLRLKPASAKGTYFQSISISSTMGPGFKLDTSSVIELVR